MAEMMAKIDEPAINLNDRMACESTSCQCFDRLGIENYSTIHYLLI